MPDLFFVVGCGRSGTSLLMSMLDMHPEITGELELFQRDFMYLSNFPRDMNVPLLQDKLTRFKENCEREASKRATRYWGNKITANSFEGLRLPKNLQLKNPCKGDHLKYFFDIVFPEAKIIFIHRNGINNIASMMRRGKRTPLEAARFWEISAQIGLWLRDKDNVKLVSFENLISSPDKTLKDISSFLNIDYNEDMLKGYANKKHFYKSSAINKTVLERKEIPEWCEKAIEPYQKEFGYI